MQRGYPSPIVKGYASPIDRLLEIPRIDILTYVFPPTPYVGDTTSFSVNWTGGSGHYNFRFNQVTAGGPVPLIDTNQTASVFASGWVFDSVGLISLSFSVLDLNVLDSDGVIFDVTVIDGRPTFDATLLSPWQYTTVDVNVMIDNVVPGTNGGGPFNVTIDWGDGASAVITDVALASFPITPGHAYSAAGSYSINVTIRDNANLQMKAQYVADVQINDGYPTVNVTPTGFTTGLSNNMPVDLAGGYNSGGSFDIAIDWGDGTSIDNYTGQLPGSNSYSHTYTVDGTYPTSVTVTDTGNGFVTAGGADNYSNPAPVPPTVDLTLNTSNTTVGVQIDGTITFDTGGGGSNFDVFIDFGESGEVPVASGVASGVVNVSNIYTTTGNYNAIARVVDNNTTLQNTDTENVTVS